MKRWISSLIIAGLATVVLAQTPFTIVRPADGSRVREKVRILIPKDSVPPGGYVGVYLDGKLIEATVPPIEGKYRVYTLDTKGRGIADTHGKPIKLEMVLYTDYQDKARVLDRSSVDINVGNEANIDVPNSGYKLRYSFSPGSQMVYNLAQNVQVSSITESQQQLGGRAAMQDLDLEHIRLLYSVDNTYSDGSGLLRMQALPTKGKDYADLTTVGATEPTRFYENEMAPIYMHVKSTGQEVFGALPPSIPLFSTSAGSVDPTYLYATWPLPTLPTKPIRPGDAWQSSFQTGDLNLAKYPNIDSVVARVPARGEFVGVEWEQGHPCAKIMNTIEAASMDTKSKAKLSQISTANGGTIDNDKISLVETIWFSLDTHKVMKIVRDETVDIKTQVQSSGGFGGMGGAPGKPGVGGPAAGGGKPGAAGAGRMGPATGNMQGKLGGMQGPPGGPGRGPQGPRGQGPMGPGGPSNGMLPGRGNQGQAGTPPQSAYVRVRFIQIFTLEK
jgi:hypothetical protein